MGLSYANQSQQFATQGALCEPELLEWFSPQGSKVLCVQRRTPVIPVPDLSLARIAIFLSVRRKLRWSICELWSEHICDTRRESTTYRLASSGVRMAWMGASVVPSEI
jgi:hypothetical protein